MHTLKVIDIVVRSTTRLFVCVWVKSGGNLIAQCTFITSDNARRSLLGKKNIIQFCLGLDLFKYINPYFRGIDKS